MKKYIIENGIKHELCGDVYYPMLKLDEQTNYKIDVQAHSMLDDIIANLARERGIDEELKVTDMLKWVTEMNNIKASAEEIVLREIIYK